MNAATLHPNLQAADLAIEIADEYARADIECKALPLPSTYTAPVYDTTRPEGPIDEPELVDSAMADVARAVRYLDLRGLLVRPFPQMPHPGQLREDVVMLLRFLTHYTGMRLSGAGHVGAKQYACNMVAAHRRACIETRGRV